MKLLPPPHLQVVPVRDLALDVQHLHRVLLAGHARGDLLHLRQLELVPRLDRIQGFRGERLVARNRGTRGSGGGAAPGLLLALAHGRLGADPRSSRSASGREQDTSQTRAKVAREARVTAEFYIGVCYMKR